MTLQALKDFGEASAVVEIVPPYQRDVQTMDELYAQAEKAQPELKKLGQSLVRKHGGALMMRTSLKGKERAEKKAQDDYNGNYSRLTDINGATLVFDTVEEAKAAFEDFRKDPRVMKDKDRYENPVGGYRDFFLLVQLPNGHIAEMQFNTAKMIAAKEGMGHKIYDVVRAIHGDVKRGRISDAQIALSFADGLNKVSKRYYDFAFENDLSTLTSSSQSDLGISDELVNILAKESESVISRQSSGDTPLALKSLKAFLSSTKGTSSFSKYLNSDILPPPFKANIQHMIDGVNAPGDTSPIFSRNGPAPSGVKAADVRKALNARDLLRTSTRKASSFIDDALFNNKRGRVRIDIDNLGHKGEIAKALGEKVRSHFLVGDDIRHMMKSHGNQRVEEGRGRPPVTPDVIKLIPWILQNYDRAYPGSDKGRRKSVRIEKRIDGKIVYVEATAGKKGVLVSKTMWIEPATEVDARRSAPNHTPKNVRSHDFNDIISTILNSVNMDGGAYFQPATGASRCIYGATTPASDGYLVQLFQGGDMSTILHEFSHVFMLEMQDVVESGSARATSTRWTSPTKPRTLCGDGTNSPKRFLFGMQTFPKLQAEQQC